MKSAVSHRSHTSIVLACTLVLVTSLSASAHVGVEVLIPKVPDPASMVIAGQDDA